MARKRVNTKFVVTLGVLVLGLMLAVLLAKKFRHQNPSGYISEGRKLMDKGQYQGAYRQFRRAVQIDPKNPDSWVALGDALSHMGSDYLNKATDAWQQAVTIDPQNKPALERLLSFWSELADYQNQPGAQGNPGDFEKVESTARALAKAEPDNVEAHASIYSATIRRWLAGVQTDQDQINKCIAGLTSLMEKHPANPDLPVFIARAKLGLANQVRQRNPINGEAEAEKLVKQANDVLEAAVKKEPSSAAMCFGAAQVFDSEWQTAHTLERQLMARLDPSDTTSRDAQRLQEYKNEAAHFATRRNELLADARKYVTQNDQLFVKINLAAAGEASRDNNHAEAEKILRNLLAKKPNDQLVRIRLAQLIGSNKRDEAIALLDQPIATSSLAGVQSLKAGILELQTLATVANLRLSAYNDAKTQAEKDKLAAKIENDISGIAQREGGDGLTSLLLRGEFQRAQGKLLDAIQTLEHALALAEQNPNADSSLQRWQITNILAQSYLQTGQTGRARTLLETLVSKISNYAPARILLAQTLIGQHETALARQQVDVLRRQLPDDPRVIKLQIKLLDSATQTQKVRELVNRLPEKTKAETLDKIRTAMAVNQHDIAIPLLESLLKKYPDDDAVLRMAFRVYQATGARKKMTAIVDRAHKLYPNNSGLGVIASVLSNATTMPANELRQKLRQELIAKTTDPFQRDILLANFAQQDGKSDEELQHLKAAEKRKPDNLDVKMRLFNLYLARKDFAQAAIYLEPLARANKDQVNGMLLKFRLEMAKGNINTAIDDARQITQMMPEFGQSWLSLGQALQAAKQYDDALSKFQTALSKQPDNAAAYRGAIECEYALGRKGEAYQLITKACTALPNDQQFAEMALNYELSYGDPEKQIPKEEEALKKQPDDPAVLLMAGRTYLAAARARLHKNPDDTSNARAYFTHAKQLFERGIAKWPDEPTFYAYAAESAAQMKDLAGAEKLLKELAARKAWKDRPEPLMLLGEFYSRTNRPDEAVKVLQEAVGKAPTNVEVELRLARVLADQNRYDDAVKALAANPDDPRVVLERIQMTITAKKYDKADSLLAAAQAKMPHSVALRALGGEISLSRNRFDEARTRLQQALQIDPKDAAANYWLGLTLMSQPKPDLDGAIQHLNACKDAAKVGADARRALANCYERKNDYGHAIQVLEDAQKANPGNRDVVLALIDAYAGATPPRWLDVKNVISEWKNAPDYRPDVQILKREANMYLAQKDYQDAATSLGEAIKLSHGNTDLVRQYLSLLFQSQNYNIVIGDTTKLVAEDPSRWWAYNARAVAKRYLGNRTGAIADYQLALASAAKAHDDDATTEIIQSMAKEIGVGEALSRIKDRAQTEPRWALMCAYLYQEDSPPRIKEAIKELNRVLAMPNLSDEDRERALRYGGALYLQGKKPDTQKAYECYLKLLDMTPNDLQALNNMACLLADQMNPPHPNEALKYSLRAYQIMQKKNINLPYILDTHGWLLVRAGQVDDGIALLQKVVDTSPIVDARYHLAVAYLKKAYPEEAQKQLELAKVMISRLNANHKPYDHSLGPKIEDALRQAQEMLESKSQATAQ